MRVLERATLEEVERLPTARIARELPGLVSEIARALAPGAETSTPQLVDWAHRLADLSGREAPDAKDLVRDLSALQSVMLAELHRGLDRIEAVSVLATVERLAELFSALHADAVEDLLSTRSSELEWLGTTYSLTGLQNTRFMQQHLNHLLGIQKRYGHPFALAYGSSAGDRTLIGVATAVGESIRTTDTPVRMGGDEFCVLLPHQTASRAKVLAERIAAAIERVENPASQPLGVSIGVVSCPQHATDADALLEVADGAMYRAKAAGERIAVGTDGASQNGDLIDD